MGKFSLENRIKERLEGHEVHVDKQELWKSLGIEDEEKDRKAIWFWWFSGTVGLLLIAGLLWFSQGDDAGSEEIQFVTESNVEDHLAKTGNETELEKSTTAKLTDIIAQTKKETGETKDSGDIKNGNEVDLLKSSTNIDKFTTATEENNEKSVSSLPSTASQLGVDSDESNDQSSHEGESIALVDGDEDKAVGLINEDKNTAVEETTLSNRRLTLEAIERIDAGLAYDRKLEGPEVFVSPIIDPIPVTKKFEVELFGGLGSIRRDLVGFEEYAGYATMRDSSESTLEHVSFGAALRYNLGSGFYGKAGLTINRWNERFQYNEVSDTMIESAQIPVVILIDLQGNETITYGEGESEIITLTNWTRYNRLTQIDLPLTLGYERNIGRWSVFGEGAAIFNISQKFSGYQYSLAGRIEKNPRIYKSRVGVNLGLNAGIGYGITPRLRARLSARYYKSLGSVLSEEDLVNQEYQSLGLRLGIGYRF